MNFIQRIINWLLGRPKSKIDQAATVANDQILEQVEIPSEDLHHINYNKKYTTTMLNSISLSSDMKTLYLIDNGRAIAFDLTAPQGVLIGKLGDQLVVATANNASLEKEEGRNAQVKRYTYKAGSNSQFNISYNQAHQAISIIGFDDIAINLEAPDTNQGTCKENIFKLAKGSYMHICNKNEMIEIHVKE